MINTKTVAWWMYAQHKLITPAASLSPPPPSSRFFPLSLSLALSLALALYASKSGSRRYPARAVPSSFTCHAQSEWAAFITPPALPRCVCVSGIVCLVLTVPVNCLRQSQKANRSQTCLHAGVSALEWTLINDQIKSVYSVPNRFNCTKK